MLYHSTRSRKLTANGPEAILRGIAPDGGLYTPLDFSEMHIDVGSLLGMSAVDIAAKVIGKLLPDFSEEEMRRLIREAYHGKFDTDELTPVVRVGDNHVLELFRGPTSAFKDVALSVLPRLMMASKEKLGVNEEIMILTATSGDTGKAALEGFRDVPGTGIIVFYPDGGVSDVQRAQMVTQEGNNVRVCAIRGNFDDAQTGVKNIFSDEAREGWAEKNGVRLSSANSINLGRLAPQVAYYFKAYADMVLTGVITLGEKINFAVPTGNFGDILAGEFARRMGLPVAKLICASNANNVLTDFIRTGSYDRRREFFKTISPSMDILVSSNLERYLLLASGGDFQLVNGLMTELSASGAYQAPRHVMEEMRRCFSAYCASDQEAIDAIGRVWNQTGYLMDPHTAVAWTAAEKFRSEEDDDHETVVLSTASPYKFSRDVLGAISTLRTEDGFEAMDALHELTGVRIPENLSCLRDRHARFRDCVDREDMNRYVRTAVER
ncbi:MAG: threonine synthase [Christensenellales bacterium]|nr:threonine synthase [Christensenellales bacterium]